VHKGNRTVAFELLQQDPGNQKSRDHEKHIHTKVSAATPCIVGVKEHHCEDRKCAQSVDPGDMPYLGVVACQDVGIGEG
jgi:hypothetical protein